MQDHEHIRHSKSGGAPSAGNGSTRVITCSQHGTMRTGGTCSQCQPTGSTSTRGPGLEAGPWGREHEARFQTAAQCDEVAAGVGHQRLGNGVRFPGEPTADFLSRTRAQAQAAEVKRAGFETADQLIRAQADAGMTPEAIGRHQEEITAKLLSDARTADGQAFAREYADTVGTYVRDLKELDGPGLTPGAPHPDSALAAKGWHVCDHGIYTRHPDGELEAEPEAC